MSGKKSFSYLSLILHFLTIVATNSSDVLYEIYPFIEIYKDGRVERLIGTEVVPASVDPTTGISPRTPLPIGYQDSWHALKWVETVLVVTLHTTAIRAGLDHEMDHRAVIDGMFLNCPHFWGKTPIGNEARNPERKALMESIWIHAYPNSTGFDDPLLNPAMDPNLSKLRGRYYEKALRKSKWDGVVKVVEVQGEDHDFNVISPNSTKAKIVLRQLASFLNQGKVLHSFAGHLTAVPSN
ncbi:UNVERIFIED_CONTAM: hypothetical protein Sangu_0639600 [Sesamum angustifolium]|uniref:Alpha/beta hydrolase fold-3 domain-containing protein n=1 Tax=Sesamum angustifolium TaxID=2727405 RepID=A0AAW2QC56_9LAMI